MPEPLPPTQDRVDRALARCTEDLLRSRGADSHWTGELSSSALSTATAVVALSIFQKNNPSAPSRSDAISAGLDWLARHQNSDGGWGDTVKSKSNISTTTLCWAAFSPTIATPQIRHASAIAAAECCLQKFCGANSHPAGFTSTLVNAIVARYGKDRTFSVPILVTCVLSGRFGNTVEAWDRVLPLPFELAAFPRRWFATLQLPVVSYALPALIALGLARHHHRPSRNPIARSLRHLTQKRTLRILKEIQPSSGGFLEATPLTSFVVMSLAGSGRAGHEVVRGGVDFLTRAQGVDGSWPIDSNLATWVTTLAANVLPALPEPNARPIRDWLLAQQFVTPHPYTCAEPGGWAWTDLPGGVPDADDTAGALLALKNLGGADAPTLTAATAGVRWLLDLQNRDGGLPTFCRGWGSLPFDRSAPDLTAHALRAWHAWQHDLSAADKARVGTATQRALDYLVRTQRENGSWIPLWFGHESEANEENPVYGTSRVILALSELARQARHPVAHGALGKGLNYLVGAQNSDGGWSGFPGGASSIEETSLALECLCLDARKKIKLEPAVDAAIQAGTRWLLAELEAGRGKDPSPIGFYFAKLWYFEKLYPLIFSVGALRAIRSLR